MKLELEHLAPYLPYKVKFMSEFDIIDPNQKNNKKWVMSGVFFDMQCYWILAGFRNSRSYPIETVKPILRPLSDLTKEIEHEGKKFVPIERIANMTNFEIGLTFFKTRNIVTLPWYVVKSLLEWHFDLDNLIESGLAIDINDLNQ